MNFYFTYSNNTLKLKVNVYNILYIILKLAKFAVKLQMIVTNLLTVSIMINE